MPSRIDQLGLSFSMRDDPRLSDTDYKKLFLFGIDAIARHTSQKPVFPAFPPSITIEADALPLPAGAATDASLSAIVAILSVAGGVESTGNTTTTPIGAAETFTGEWEQNSRPEVMVSCFSDTAGTLYFDFSVDGVNPYPFPPDGFHASAGIHEFHVAIKGPRYFRVRFVNSEGAQGTFRLFTYYGIFRPPNSPLNAVLADDADATIVRSITEETMIAESKYDGRRIFNKFGRNPDVDAAEDIWDGGGDYTGFPTGAAEELQVLSTDAADAAAGTGARTVRVFYLDASKNAFDASGNPLYVDVRVSWMGRWVVSGEIDNFTLLCRNSLTDFVMPPAVANRTQPYDHQWFAVIFVVPVCIYSPAFLAWLFRNHPTHDSSPENGPTAVFLRIKTSRAPNSRQHFLSKDRILMILTTHPLPLQHFIPIPLPSLLSNLPQDVLLAIRTHRPNWPTFRLFCFELCLATNAFTGNLHVSYPTTCLVPVNKFRFSGKILFNVPRVFRVRVAGPNSLRDPLSPPGKKIPCHGQPHVRWTRRKPGKPIATHGPRHTMRPASQAQPRVGNSRQRFEGILYNILQHHTI